MRNKGDERERRNEEDYQASKDAEKLNHICERHGIQTTNNRVDHCDTGGDDDSRPVVDSQYHRQATTCVQHRGWKRGKEIKNRNEETSDTQNELLPRAERMAADQKMSPIRAGMYSSDVATRPYCFVIGSKMVT